MNINMQSSSDAETFRTLFDTLVDGLISINSVGIINSFNPAAEKHFGYSAHEVIGQNINILMPEPYHSEHDGYLHSYADSGDKKIIGIGREVIGLRKDGSTFPMALAVSEMEIDGEKVYTGIVRDLTDQRQAEMVLKNSEERLRAIFDTLVDGLITINSVGIINSFNPAAEKHFGYSAHEVIGQNINILMPEPYHSEHDGYLHSYADSGDKKIIGIGREVIGLRKDGTAFPMALAVSEMEIDGEKMYTGIVRDLTDQKAAEAEIIQSAHDLTIAKESAESALDRVKLLSGLIPICVNCKKIRDDKGYYQQIEHYITDHSEAEFSHGLCPNCAKDLYPDINFSDL